MFNQQEILNELAKATGETERLNIIWKMRRQVEEELLDSVADRITHQLSETVRPLIKSYLSSSIFFSRPPVSIGIPVARRAEKQQEDEKKEDKPQC